MCELVREVPDAPEAPALGADACREVLTFAFRLGISDDEREAAIADGVAWAKQTGDPFYEGRMHQAISVAHATVGRLDAALERAAAWEPIAAMLPQEDRSATRNWPFFYPLLVRGELGELRQRARWQVDATQGPPEWGMRDWRVSAHVDALSILAVVEGYMGAIAAGREMCQRAADVARSLADPESESWAWARLAELEWLAGETDAARAASQRTVELAERVGSSLTRIWSHTRAAWALVTDGQLQAALAGFELVRDLIAQGAQVAELGRAIAGQAEALRLLGEAGRARTLAEESLATSRENGARIDALYATLSLAPALRADGALDRVPSLLDDAEQIVAETGAVAWTPLLELERAELAALTADEAARERARRRALEGFREVGATGPAARLDALLAGAG